MKYKLYHELLYQIAKRLADHHLKRSLRCIGVMKKNDSQIKSK